MKNISLNPFALAIALLASFALGALLVYSHNHKYDRGLHDGRMLTQRNVAEALAVLMREGIVVRQSDGKDAVYVLQPVAKIVP